MKAKKAIIIPIILSSLLLTACGESEESASYTARNDLFTDNYAGEYAETADEEVNIGEAEADNSESKTSSDSKREHNTSDKLIEKEMLVYSCNMTVDVLDFDTAINSFKQNIDVYGAFVGSENYTDGGSGNRYYDKNEERWKTYSATIRVPSSSYSAFCDATANLGDLRYKTANVENLTHEYTDLSSTLDIYEAKEKRYQDLLDTITDEKEAIAVEEELTSIQIEISKLKTRMNDIKTDVAYSYVNVTINEVKEYEPEPEPEIIKEDTFLDRLSNTVSGATSTFLKIMETLLFIFIYLFPYAAVIGLVVFIIVKLCKAADNRKKKRYQQMMEASQNNIPQPLQNQTVPPTPTELTDTNDSDTEEETEEKTEE